MDDRTAFTLDESGTIGEALRAAGGACLADARAAISDPARSDAEAVHDFRRAMKRWRALLRLFELFLGPQANALRHEARDLARNLAGARDAQSALEALADLQKHDLALSARSMALVGGRIEQLRRAAETTLNADMRVRLSSALDNAKALLGRWPLSTITPEALADALARFYRRARRHLPADWSVASAEELHELRKCVVIHRYQIELAEPLWPRFVKMWTSEAQRLREHLGKHQDLLLLANLTGPRQPLARWRSRLIPAIAARQAAHVATAERIAARLFLEKPRTMEHRLAAMWRMQKEAA
jgi:CHAD domain-containing protein